MSNTAIHCEGLSKQYRIGALKPYRDLRDAITETFSAPFRRIGSALRGHGGANNKGEFVWALKDASFEVRHGEAVGVIGRNGAGKSTLLKVLARITEPTAGQATIEGRVGSLLEVGTGFHPDLTGRENTYLNGAILGMKKGEIKRKFDEIVDFAEVEKFIDTPVKHYSSGMYLRLAFAVAAHLEPEVLIVDEVLAVGDVAFQEKCLGKMGKVAKEGRAVLFVSHNLPAVQHLCNRTILLRMGQVEHVGRTAEVVEHYLKGSSPDHGVSVRDWPDRDTTGEGRLVDIEILNEKKQKVTAIAFGESVEFVFHAEFAAPIVNPAFGVVIYNALGESILDINSSHSGFRVNRVSNKAIVRVRLDKLGLYPGRYLLSPWIADAALTHIIDIPKLCCTLQVHPAPGPFGDMKLDQASGKYWVPSEWEVNSVS